MKNFLIEILGDNEFKMSVPCDYKSTSLSRQGIEIVGFELNKKGSKETVLDFFVSAQAKQTAVVSSESKSDAMYLFSKECAGFGHSVLTGPYSIKISGLTGSNHIMTEKSKLDPKSIEAINQSIERLLADQTLLSLSAIASNHTHRPRVTRSDEMDATMTDKVLKIISPAIEATTFEISSPEVIPIYYGGARRCDDGKIELTDISFHKPDFACKILGAEVMVSLKCKEYGKNQAKVLNMDVEIKFLKSDRGGSTPDMLTDETVSAIKQICIDHCPKRPNINENDKKITGIVRIHSTGSDLIFDNKTIPSNKVMSRERELEPS
jgi:hypothetical protein